MYNKEGKNQTESKSLFHEKILNNSFVIFLVILLLSMVTLYVFTQILDLLEPILIFVQLIAFPVIAAGIFFYIFNPLVNFLERRGLDRMIAIWIIFIIAVMLMVWGLYALIPMLEHQINSFIQSVPEYNQQIRQFITELPMDARDASLYEQVWEILDSMNLMNLTDQAKQIVNSTFGGIGSVIGSLAMIVTGLLTFPIILYYMLLEKDKIADRLLYIIPTAHRAMVSRILIQANQQVAKYIGGQILVAMVVGVMFSIGYSVIELEYGVLLAVIAAFCNVIPYVGSIIAAIPALVIGLLSSPLMFIKVALVITIEQFIEGRFVSPQILGSNLNIHPVTILFILLGAGRLFGVTGVILGVPVYAVIKVVVTELYGNYRRHSKLYEDESLMALRPSYPPLDTAKQVENDQDDEVK